jgi:EmrB/QacA subfamily drug resistance transporter
MTRTERSPWSILAVLVLATLAINIDTTIVNVALPTLVRDLHASLRELQWIVDGYNLAFAALVLAAGNLGDRFGRRGALLLGLAVFVLGSAGGAMAGTPGELVTARVVMGVGAAVIFPTTLSILTNVFLQRRARAAAIGIWAGVAGLGVALGPIVGGWLLEHFWWGSVFLAVVPLGVLVFALVVVLVPTSRAPAATRLDLPGLLLAGPAAALLVYTIIEAPGAGWTAGRTTLGWFGSALLLAALVGWERRVPEPMLDVRLFANPRFSAASGAVTVSFFTLFGFIFLVTQYFQFVKAYHPFETGIRMLPVAGTIALGSVLGSRLAMRAGTNVVVAGGLGLLAVAYGWIATASAGTGYPQVAGQMVLLGSGLGLTSAAATEAVMGAVARHKAGVGSAVNDTTRLLGGTLGVAVLGSVFASYYTAAMSPARLPALPADAVAAARESLGGALAVAERLRQSGGTAAARQLGDAAAAGFFSGLHAACLVAAAVSALGAVAALRILPPHPAEPAADTAGPEPAAGRPAGHPSPAGIPAAG